jgi:3-hydroxymyristoyl/3-hydroxydecanoyl-(acyl carrier protein) dehydratase
VRTHNDLVKIWPEVLAENMDESQVALHLLIPKDLDYFNGHFPNAPILAGVVQLHWAVEYAKKYFSLTELDVQNIEVLKFQVVIIPEQKINLTLTRKPSNKVLFSYASGKGQHASGRIVFEETV